MKLYQKNKKTILADSQGQEHPRAQVIPLNLCNCTNKTNRTNKDNAKLWNCTKKTKKTIPQESWRLGGWASGLLRDWFYWFLLRKTNKTNPDSAKCCNCTKKTNKTNSPGVLETGRLGLRTPGELVLLFFLVQLQHLALSGLVLLVFLSKNQ